MQFRVIHKKGSENSNADALSRADHLPEPGPEEEMEQSEFIGAVGTELTRARILEAQAVDGTLKLVRKTTIHLLIHCQVVVVIMKD